MQNSINLKKQPLTSLNAIISNNSQRTIKAKGGKGKEWERFYLNINENYRTLQQSIQESLSFSKQRKKDIKTVLTWDHIPRVTRRADILPMDISQGKNPNSIVIDLKPKGEKNLTSPREALLLASPALHPHFSVYMGMCTKKLTWTLAARQ